MNHADSRAQQDPLSTGRPVLVEVISDLMARRNHGVKKYNQELKAENGRNPLIDLYQELIDAVMYVKQELMEQELRTPQFTPRELELMRMGILGWAVSIGANVPNEKSILPTNPNELQSLAEKLRDLVAAGLGSHPQSR